MVRHLSDRWLRAYESGAASSIDIARAIGSTPASVLKALRAQGVRIRGPGPARVEVPPHLAEAYRGGHRTIAEIAEALGCSLPCVRRALHRLGIDTPHRARVNLPEHVVAAYRAGRVPVRDLIVALGCSTATFYNALLTLGISGRRRRAKPLTERDRTIIAAYRQGETLSELGRRFKLSRQRVHQIIRKVSHPVPRHPGGK